MPVCPECQRAYPEGTLTCEACDHDLVKTPPTDPRQGELFEVVEIYAIPDEITGLALKSYFADSGLETMVRELQASFYGTILNPGGTTWGKLLVAKEHEAKARRLLRQFLTEFQGR